MAAAPGMMLPHSKVDTFSSDGTRRCRSSSGHEKANSIRIRRIVQGLAVFLLLAVVTVGMYAMAGIGSTCSVATAGGQLARTLASSEEFRDWQDMLNRVFGYRYHQVRKNLQNIMVRNRVVQTVRNLDGHWEPSHTTGLWAEVDLSRSLLEEIPWEDEDQDDYYMKITRQKIVSKNQSPASGKISDLMKTLDSVFMVRNSMRNFRENVRFKMMDTQFMAVILNVRKIHKMEGDTQVMKFDAIISRLLDHGVKITFKFIFKDPMPSMDFIRQQENTGIVMSVVYKVEVPCAV